MEPIPPRLPDLAPDTLQGREVYLCGRTYEENYRDGPARPEHLPQNLDLPSRYSFLGFRLKNPVGVAAGPLLNAKWVRSYLEHGFAVPVYKTVRSIFRASLPAPNCVYVDTEPLEPTLQTRNAPSDIGQLSLANSFGVPSMAPQVWMPDVELAGSYCGEGQLLIVSIMGTEGAEGRSLVQDFGYTAALAREAGARAIEANLSCPNLRGGGMLYADAANTARIAREIRESIGKSTTLLLKVGYQSAEQLKALVAATRPYVDAYSGINTLRTKVRQPNGELAVPGRLKIGIGGAAIRRLAGQFAQDLDSLRRARGDDFAIVGIGGMMDAADLEKRLQDGADLVMSATAAMWDPYLALRWQSCRSIQ